MVTKQQQLEWLAKNVSRFPDGFHKVFASVYCVGSLVGLHATEKHEITREEWQQERDKMQKQDNSWYERGEFPPVGSMCMSYDLSDDKWIETEIVAHRDGCAIGWCHTEMCGYIGADKSDFRPLRAEREKAIDALIEIICAGGELSKDGSAAREIAERIYEAQQTKEQTK